MAASAEVPVVVVDRVTLPRTEAGAWVARMHREYRPGAEARGASLAGVWRTRAAAAHAVEVVVAWSLPDVRAFWRFRAGSTDPAVTAWWADTDGRALARSRSVMEPGA